MRDGLGVVRAVRSAGVAALAVGLLALGACGSSGSSDSSATTKAGGSGKATTTRPTTTDKPTTTEKATTTTLPATDAPTRALAVAGSFVPGDLPPVWTIYEQGNEPASPPPAGTCSATPASPERKLLRGARIQSPTWKFGKTGSYVGTFTYAFDSAATAEAFIAIVKTPAWAACQVKQFQKFQQDHKSTYKMRLETRDQAGLGQGGFESYASFAAVDPTSGQASLYTNYAYYRQGRVVIRLGTDLSSIDAAGADAFAKDVNAALTAAYRRVQALPYGG
jgi:hypothetical protein